ncbi:response regulator [Capillimicrobium parvum]|uniref:Response regulator UvrY n=1 Tax=Capillimicrobium parvum TaxID=2884022 RepID=A0A9E7C011_9ACTN|nr:response regulator transcription factor [Capillimicrobium parvum]UGS35896.1 Response regulator UvrY [Capillimicrobium parvum]
MIRIVVIDDHPALRAGVRTVIEAEPGLVFAGESAGDEESLWPLLHRTRPDLVLLDYHLPSTDGLQLCHRIKRQATPPRVLVHSAYASPPLALPAILARADGLVDKGLAARELFAAIRLVHRGDRLIPEVSPYLRGEALSQLDERDRPIVGMLLDGASDAEIAQAAGVEAADVEHATRRILARLTQSIPVAGG